MSMYNHLNLNRNLNPKPIYAITNVLKDPYVDGHESSQEGATSRIPPLGCRLGA